VEDLIDGFIAKTAIDTVIDAGSIIQAMRLVKSPDELEMIREAVSITAKAQREMMRVTRPGAYEYEVEAAIEYVFKQSGSSYPGFPSIVASGPNATTLHYIESTRQMLRNELLLVDIGAEYNLYSGDLTRTVPVNGKFHRNQAALYNIVLEALTEATEAVKPGITIRELHQISAKTISEGLLELGILEGDLDAVMENRLYGKFFPHGVSHHLGLDVHDPGQYRESHIHNPLQSGMVITIEPGIYIRPDENVDSRWHNIGIRIEDDILVTDTGHEILSDELPRTVREIENIMKRSPEFVKISP
jgi:Xaa-Pro aminopeptidase